MTDEIKGAVAEALKEDRSGAREDTQNPHRATQRLPNPRYGVSS